jgi:hypothetical protein
MPTLSPALQSELGQAGAPGSADSFTFGERTRELQWPACLGIYDAMRDTDTGIRSNLRAVKLPILATDWRIRRGTRVRPAVAEFIEAELGLTRDEDGQLRTRDGGVNWLQFLGESLTHLEFGHAPFEQVYALGAPDTPGLVIEDGLAQVAHLRKLAFRPQASLASVDVAPDGGLAGIRQFVTDPTSKLTRVATIPVDRLVMFVNEREGANWLGRSVLRSAYKNWMIHDTLLRLSAIGADRQSMGLPVVTYSKDREGLRARAIEIARQARVGEDAGLALPSDMELTLLGVAGGTVDPLPLIKYHDEAASKAVLAMFLDLGHDAGARSLGSTFLDFFLLSLGAVVRHIEEVVTEHVIRDLVRINFGPQEAYPSLKADPIDAEGTPTAEALATLANAGLLGPVGEELVNDVRRRNGLPPMPAGSMTGPVGAQDPTVLPDGTVALPTGAPGTPTAPGGPAAGALPGTGVIAPQAAVVTLPVTTGARGLGSSGRAPGSNRTGAATVTRAPGGAAGPGSAVPVVRASAAPVLTVPSVLMAEPDTGHAGLHEPGHDPGDAVGLVDEMSARVARLHATMLALSSGGAL